MVDPHPTGEDVNPTYYGHSVGRWENETLVIDTVGFNERFWMSGRPVGMVHTDQLHLIERISRPDFNTLRYEATIDDPGAYTRPWTAQAIQYSVDARLKARSSSARTTTGTGCNTTARSPSDDAPSFDLPQK